ncbi:hypothetical protein [Streptomyces albidus (ex Kaewkla and Franco 2022)]|uniref:hypothetical protein n=1 Tax=Streptomyces albidus (ex Kaewkla and Franco 2022) TaxID=722709 RepID=UPI0015EEE0EF|nr:hypothetical protein [Streptomyces albidus (ex Kaewkla and Franco 2022)]
MPSTDDVRKTLTDPKPLYFAAGVLDKIREEAPERIAAVRATDPKEVQARVSKQAKETQAKVSETLGNIDTDIKKLREQAQHLALQSLGVAAEYAVKAREAYDDLADRGRDAVKNWRGEDDGQPTQVTVEREPVKVAEPPAEPRGGAQSGTKAQGGTQSQSTAAKTDSTARKTTTAKTTAAPKTGTAKTGTAKTGTAKSNGTKKTSPKSDS